jgi:hypothetical protein
MNMDKGKARLLLKTLAMASMFAFILVTGFLAFGYWACGDCIYKNHIKTIVFEGTHEYPDLKANPLSAYFEIQVLNKSRFTDGRPYLVAYGLNGHVLNQYYPLSEEHFQYYKIGHTYLIERDMWNSDIIPLKEITSPEGIPFHLYLNNNCKCSCAGDIQQ